MTLIQYNGQGQAVGPCIIAKDEAEDAYATTLVGPNWHQAKMRPFGSPDPDLLMDFGWISAQQVEQEAIKAEVGILWI